MDYNTSATLAAELDKNDELNLVRHSFDIPKYTTGKEEKEYVYFCGHSLGPRPKKAAEYVNEVLNDWAHLGVEGHFLAKHPWMPYHEFVTHQMAKIVGALDSEVVVMNTLSTNLHLMMVSFYQPQGKKKKILFEPTAFPSDRYAIQSHIQTRGLDPKECMLEFPLEKGEFCIQPDKIYSFIEANHEDVELIVLGGVQYLSGQLFPLKEITQLAQKFNIKVGLDLAHGAGNVPLKLHDWNVDFAVWCTYKYLNSGPGSLGGVFIHEKWAQNKSIKRFGGWWGHNKETRFQMGPDFDPIPTAEGWQLSNPPIFPLASMRASLEIFDQVGIENIRKKSLNLTGYMEFLLKNLPGPQVEIITPSDPNQRGHQLSFKIPSQDKNFIDKLKQKGIICDFRYPNIIRATPVALFNNFQEVYFFANTLKKLLS